MSANHKATSKHLLELWFGNALHRATDYLAPSYLNLQMPDAFGGISIKSRLQN